MSYSCRYTYYDEMMRERVAYYVYGRCITIIETYKIKDDDFKWRVINHLKDTTHSLLDKRSAKSIFNEIKAHNIFYQRGWYKKSTKNSDIEFKQSFWIRLGYSIICLLFKER